MHLHTEGELRHVRLACELLVVAATIDLVAVGVGIDVLTIPDGVRCYGVLRLERVAGSNHVLYPLQVFWCADHTVAWSTVRIHGTIGIVVLTRAAVDRINVELVHHVTFYEALCATR